MNREFWRCDSAAGGGRKRWQFNADEICKFRANKRRLRFVFLNYVC